MDDVVGGLFCGPLGGALCQPVSVSLLVVVVPDIR